MVQGTEHLELNIIDPMEADHPPIELKSREEL